MVLRKEPGSAIVRQLSQPHYYLSSPGKHRPTTSSSSPVRTYRLQRSIEQPVPHSCEQMKIISKQKNIVLAFKKRPLQSFSKYRIRLHFACGRLISSTSLINILLLTVALNDCCSWAAQHRFSARHGGGGVNYAERWREARQPLWWTVSFKHGPLPAVLQWQGSPVGLGIRPNWGQAEMADSARKWEPVYILLPQIEKGETRNA